ncbi:pentapeptide repeat-containing protein [Spirillospora sp. NPDC050679]
MRVLPRRAYSLGAAMVAAPTGVVAWWLLGEAGGDAKLRMEAIRTALTVGLGAGGAFALAVQARRQWLREQAHQQLLHAHQAAVDAAAQAHQERLAEAAERDATERRVTELYNAAATQLASDKAPVRLTALYTLERLAGANPGHRQTIVDIICAYLRLPYTPAADRQRQAARRYHAARTRTASAATPSAAFDPYEERQVRLTAQRILHTHLQPDAVTGHWAGIDLDLTGATLLDFDLSGCRLNTATFTDAKFVGEARFIKTEIDGSAWFAGAEIDGDACFIQARIRGGAGLFGGGAVFRRARIGGDARFEGAKIEDAARFEGVKVGGNAGFSGVKVGGDAGFSGAGIGGNATFEGAEVGGHAWFAELEIGGHARFDRMKFGRDAWFGRARFEGGARFDGTTISGCVSFADVKAGGVLHLATLRLANWVMMRGLPPGWRIEPEEGAAGRVVAELKPGD